MGNRRSVKVISSMLQPKMKREKVELEMFVPYSNFTASILYTKFYRILMHVSGLQTMRLEK